MKNIMKLGTVGLLSSILLSGCFENSAEDTVKTFMKGLINNDWESASKVIEEKTKVNISSMIKLQCLNHRKQYILKLEENGINYSQVLDLPIETQDKLVSLCLETLYETEKDANKTSFDILSSKINDSGTKASVVVEVTRPNGHSRKKTFKLKKIDDEWKLIGNLL